MKGRQTAIVDAEVNAEPEQRLAAAMLRDAREEAMTETRRGRGKIARAWLASDAVLLYMGALVSDIGEFERQVALVRRLG